MPNASLLENFMPEFLIEREMPGVGQLGPQGLQTCLTNKLLCARSTWPKNTMGEELGDRHKLYSIFHTRSEDLVRENARFGGAPINKVSEVRGTINPTTAE